jgi:vacuolar protein sorting-associated protein 13A/C
MVFESLVASVLSSVLGDYVTDLQTSQLSVSIFSGSVTLSNLKLKTSALDKFKLPINVIEGYMGGLNMLIPWSDLKNKPIKIEIERVYLIAVPKGDGDWDYQQEFDAELKVFLYR